MSDKYYFSNFTHSNEYILKSIAILIAVCKIGTVI